MDFYRSLHFVGIGGIGMSALAQMSQYVGIKTTGSDRAAASPENERIFHALKNEGIGIYPQDGSVYQHETPEALVYSTAIEENNPDFACAPAGIPRLHRSAALSMLVAAVRAGNTIAVSGTCGKTSVTAQMTDALYHLNAEPGMLCGGLVNSFVSPMFAGNFRAGLGRYFVLEADESDKSLLNYTADTAMVLNIGTDHYSKEELADVFRQFIRNTRKNIIIADTVLDAVGDEVCREKNTILFSGDHQAPDSIRGFPVVKLNSYRVEAGGAYCSFDGMPEIRLRAPGHHNALNSLAVYAALLQMGFSKQDSFHAVSAFGGVWRRFDFAGELPGGAQVYDDYAHNPEKILSCLDAAKSISAGRVFLLFQPHGYKPFGDMRQVLFEDLQRELRPGDVFGLLPVYYAGGTSCFTPKAEDVAESYRQLSGIPERYPFFADRGAAEDFLKNNVKPGETVVIMGARDNSLSIWAKKITKTA